MALWAKVDVDMPTDRKLLGQPVATRLLWLCLICLAKQQDDHGAIRGYDCGLLSGRFNVPRGAVARALTHYQLQRMIELDPDGTIRLLNFDRRQGAEDTANERQRRYYDSHREEILEKKKSSREEPNPVLTDSSRSSSREDSSLEQSREEVEKNRTEKKPRSKSLEAKASQGVALATAAAPPEAPTSAVWTAYEAAYENRYGEKPTRNKAVNGKLAVFITRVPAADAPAIAAFYVSHPMQLYVRAMHCVDLLLRDAEQLRTQWRTGRKVTETTSRQEEKTAANAEGWAALLKGGANVG